MSTSQKLTFKLKFAEELQQLEEILKANRLDRYYAADFVLEMVLMCISDSTCSCRSLDIILGEYIDGSFDCDQYGNFLPIDLDLAHFYCDVVVFADKLLEKISIVNDYFKDNSLTEVYFSNTGDCLLTTEGFTDTTFGVI